MDTDRTSRPAGPAGAAGAAGAGPDGHASRPGQAITAGLRVTGAGLLITAAAIHLDLYLTGYRSVPVIGGLFLLQVIVGLTVGVLVLVTGSRVAAAAGAMFALATLGGYLLSVWVGLFGFTEVRTTAGIVSGVVDVAAFAALAALAARPWPPAGPAATAVLKTTTINGATVLTNGKGLTLYWFAPDSPARSVCTGACARYWPPLTGRPTAGPDVTGRLGAITRSDGSKQATYDGHPLYTYIADTAPGQAHGNNLNLNGGLWHEVTVPG